MREETSGWRPKMQMGTRWAMGSEDALNVLWGLKRYVPGYRTFDTRQDAACNSLISS